MGAGSNLLARALRETLGLVTDMHQPLSAALRILICTRSNGTYLRERLKNRGQPNAI